MVQIAPPLHIDTRHIFTRALPQAEVATLFAGAMIVTVAAIAGFFFLFLLRGGLGDAPVAITLIAAMGLLPVWLSAWALSLRSGGPLSSATAAAAALLLGFLLPLVGLLLGRSIGFFACVLLLVAGALSARSIVVRRFGWGYLVYIAVFTLLLVLTTAPWRFFLPEAMALGIASSDSYFHAAIAQMIANYGRISTGADGLAQQHYHFLSHMMAAGIGRSSGAFVPDVYLYWGAFSLKLQLVWAFFVAGLQLSASQTEQPQASVAVRLGYAWIAALFVGALDSESLILALAMFVGLFPLLLALMRAPEARGGLMMSVLLVCAAAFVCSAAKASVGYFYAIALVLILWRARERPAVVATVAASLAGLAIFTYLFVLPRDLEMSGAPLAIRAASYLQYATWHTVFSYSLPLLVLLIGVVQPRLNAAHASMTLHIPSAPPPASGNRFTRFLKWAHQADVVAQFLLLSILGCLLVLVGTSIGSNNIYFTSVLFGLALLLLPASFASILDTAIAGIWIKLGVALTLVANMLPVLAAYPANLMQAINGLYQAPDLSSARSAKEDIMASLRETRQPFAFFGAELARSPWLRLEASLKEQALAVNGSLVVSIAPSADDVWQRLRGSSPWWCMAPHLQIPARTGLVEFRSIAPGRIESKCAPPGLLWYGFGVAQNAHRSLDYTPAQLCAAAAGLKARKIYRLNSYKDLSRNYSVTCGNS